MTDALETNPAPCLKPQHVETATKSGGGSQSLASYLKESVERSIRELALPLRWLAWDCEPPPQKFPRDATILGDTAD